MDWILAELAEPFERMSPATATAALRERWGVEATKLEPLDTERDDSWHVTTADAEYVLKVSHPSDPAGLVEVQSLAMAAAADAGLPVQRLVAALDGNGHPRLDGRIARLLTWLDGDLLLDSARPDALLHECGAALARLASAIKDIDHPDARRTFAWDLQSLARLRELPHPPAADTVFDALEGIDLDALPRQFIHNDFHPGNVLVRDGRLAGILDFGDCLEAPRVQDLGVALAYHVPREGDPWAAAAVMLEGYESVTPLLDVERAALPTLVAGRLVQRIVLPPVLEPGIDPAWIDRMTHALENVIAHPLEH